MQNKSIPEMTRFTIVFLVFSGALQASSHPGDTFHQLVCQQCNSWCSAEQSTPTVDGPARVGKAGPRGPIGPRGEPGIVNVTAVEAMVDRKIQKAVGFLSVRSCHDVDLESAKSTNVTGGVFDIFILGKTTVYCDDTTDGGGWIVIQRRMDGSVDFHRNWNSYVNGFGEVDKEFWLGLKAIHQLTRDGDQELRVDMIEKRGTRYYAKYSTFKVGPASDNYRLSVTGYSGNATDSLRYHNGQQFSTSDADNDSYGSNCAKIRRAAWWYNSCDKANLNGQFAVMDDWAAIYWYDQSRKQRIHMRFSEMKIRAKR